MSLFTGNVRDLRLRLGMSQAEFSRAFRISRGTLQDWEQRRAELTMSVRVLLTIIEHDPKRVQEILNEADNSSPNRS